MNQSNRVSNHLELPYNGVFQKGWPLVQNSLLIIKFNDCVDPLQHQFDISIKVIKN